MRFVVYDFEVSSHDWLVVLKDYETKQYIGIHNDNELFKQCITKNVGYVGYNCKGYDYFIAKAIWLGFTPEQVKGVNDLIIGGRNGWSIDALRESPYFNMPQVDLMDDTQAGTSLKSIEGHLGMNIQETEVDFNLDRPWTDEEIKLMFKYCKADVDMAEKLFELRRKYLETKINIAVLGGMDPLYALGLTNAKLTAKFLGATKIEHDDERDYKYPDNLLREYIPDEVFKYFDRLHDEYISDEQLIGKNLQIHIGECEVTLGLGGIHAALPNYVSESTLKRILRNLDVGSYYPHLMTINGYTSRNIPNPGVFADVLERRMKAKASGDKKTANSLKLICNTTYGASGDKYNNLYDLLMARSVCISGQLYLLELAEHLYQEIPNLVIVQLNTDGIMVEFDVEYYPQVQAIAAEWQARTGFELEEDKIAKIVQKDVNNYIEVQEDGSVKSKGGYLVRGISEAGAFKVNNNAVCVAEAIKAYFVDGTDPRITIESMADDKSKFQLIAKASSKYQGAYQEVLGTMSKVQRCNRVYAIADESWGTLYKQPKGKETFEKIGNLPEHCMIDNDNTMDPSLIDTEWYIQLAKKRINDFLGVENKKGKKKMATKKEEVETNIYKRLLTVREKFQEGGFKKTGKNPQLRSFYFTLDDIVPKATELFVENDLLPLVSITEEHGTMTLVDTKNPENKIVFEIPTRRWDGNAAVTPVQALGATVTYMRRYLYLIALDIVEIDEIENGFVSQTPAQQAKPTAPATPEQRQEVKKELTASDDKATELQLNGLKTVIKNLLTAHPEQQELVNTLALQTNSFTTLTKKQCEELIQKLGGMI